MWLHLCDYYKSYLSILTSKSKKKEKKRNLDCSESSYNLKTPFQVQEHQYKSNNCISCCGPRLSEGIFALQPCAHILFCKTCTKNITFPSNCPYCQSEISHIQEIIVPTF